MARRRTWTADQVLSLRARARAGESVVDLAEEAGVTWRTLYYALAAIGRPMARPGHGTSKWTRPMVRQAFIRYCRGEHSDDLAAEIGATAQGLLRRFREMGLDVRAAGPRLPRTPRRVVAKHRPRHECIYAEGFCLGCDEPMGAASVA